MGRHLTVVALFVAAALGLVLAQGAGYKSGNAISVVTTTPALCNAGETAIVTTTSPTSAMGTYFCTQPNVWQRMTSAVTKNFTGLQNNVFADVLTITIPNSGVSALIQVDLVGSLGPGGAVGAFEASTGRTIYIAVARVINVASDTTTTIAVTAADAKVLGGAGITLATQIAPLVGTPTQQQTATLQARVTRGGGTSDNHMLSLRAQVLRTVAGVNIS